MSDNGVLEQARDAFADRRWADAFALYEAADRLQPLALPDLEQWGRAAAILARDQDSFRIGTRGYEEAMACGALDFATRAAFWHGYRLLSLGEAAQGGAWLARAQELVDRRGECVERGYLLLPRIRRALADRDHALAAKLASEAHTTGADFQDSDLCAMSLELQGRALILAGNVEDGLARYDQAMLTATGESGSELVRGLVYCSVIAGCQLVYAVDRAREWTSVLSDWCQEQPQLGFFSRTCRVHRAELMQFSGAWNDALAEIAVLPEARWRGGADLAGAAYQAAEIHRFRGEYREAEAGYAQTAEHGGDTQPGLALLRLAQGAIDAAVGGIGRALQTTADPLRRARYLPAAVEILVTAGKLEEAENASHEMTETARLFGTPMLQAIDTHAGGAVALARSDAATALPLLKASHDAWQALDAPYLTARLKVKIAAACEMLGDADGARLERDAARRVFRELGAIPELSSLETANQDSASPLTRREIEVLRLAANGRTNRQIAAQLGLSGRTVDRHVSNILMKLDVPSRAAATAYAYEHGLVGTAHPAG
jgi:DNA-binding CsgD family transcriptional regulator